MSSNLSLSSRIKLNNGIEMPIFGLGKMIFIRNHSKLNKK